MRTKKRIPFHGKANTYENGYCVNAFKQHDYLQEILQSHSFLTSQELETEGCQWYGVKRIKPIFANKRKSGVKFGAPLYYLQWFAFLK